MVAPFQVAAVRGGRTRVHCRLACPAFETAARSSKGALRFHRDMQCRNYHLVQRYLACRHDLVSSSRIPAALAFRLFSSLLLRYELEKYRRHKSELRACQACSHSFQALSWLLL